MTTSVSRTLTSNGSRRKATISFWYKKCEIGTSRMLFQSYSSGGNNQNLLTVNDDTLRFGSQVGNSYVINLITNRKFRDTNAWYHIVISVDTEQGTNSNRAKMYINGVQETSFSTEVYPSQNQDLQMNISGEHFNININGDGAGMEASCVYSHVHFIDGTAYNADTFGETDATTGEWKIKTSPSVTYGTNGFFILKDGNSVTDQSGNSNNFTATGTLTKTEDNPSNIFCTGNPLARYGGNLNYTNGNNFITGGGNNWTMGSATMGASTGKYYYELKILSAGTGSGYFKMGFQSADQSYANAGHSAQSELDASYAFYCQNGNLEVRTDGAVISGYDISTLGVSFSMNDIMCLAIDMDNKKAYFRKNADAWIKSADPVNGTNGLDVSSEYPAGKGMVPNFAIYYPGTAALNFGNGYFGTTAVSSAGTNASGIGIFEYDVPTGYTALSTKGLNL